MPTLQPSEHMGVKKITLYLHAFMETVFPLHPVRAQVLWTEMYKNHVARKLLELRDLLKCPAAGNGNNTHSKETTQRITSIFVQHD